MTVSAELEEIGKPVEYVRPSRRNDAERESHYLDWLERKEVEDTEEVRARWFRRYRRPGATQFHLGEGPREYTPKAPVQLFTAQQRRDQLRESAKAVIARLSGDTPLDTPGSHV